MVACLLLSTHRLLPCHPPLHRRPRGIVIDTRNRIEMKFANHLVHKSHPQSTTVNKFTMQFCKRCGGGGVQEQELERTGTKQRRWSLPPTGNNKHFPGKCPTLTSAEEQIDSLITHNRSRQASQAECRYLGDTERNEAVRKRGGRDHHHHRFSTCIIRKQWTVNGVPKGAAAAAARQSQRDSSLSRSTFDTC